MYFEDWKNQLAVEGIIDDRQIRSYLDAGTILWLYEGDKKYQRFEVCE